MPDVKSPERTSAVPRHAGKAVVLLVEDDRSVRESILRLLLGDGQEVLAAHSPEEALSTGV